jgi:hypothetical protein
MEILARQATGNSENDVGAKNLSPPRMNIIVNQKKRAKDFSPLHLNVIANPEGEAIQGFTGFWIASRYADTNDGNYNLCFRHW